MKKLRETYVLSEEGEKSLKKSVIASVLAKMAVLLPLAMLAFLAKIVSEENGLSVKMTALSIGLGVLLLIGLIVLVRYQYRKTNIPTYEENEKLRLILADKFLRISMNELDQKGLAELSQNLISDTNANEKILSAILPVIYSTAIVLPLMAGLLAVLNPILSLAIFLPVPLALLVLLFTMKLQEKLTEEQIPVKREASLKLHEYVEGLSEMRANGILQEKQKELTDVFQKVKVFSARMELTSGVCVAGADALVQIGIGLVIYLVCVLLVGGKIRLPEVVFFLAVVLTVYGPVVEMFGAIPSKMYFQKTTERMRHLLTIPDLSGTEVLEQVNANLEFRNVGFVYGKKDERRENAEKTYNLRDKKADMWENVRKDVEMTVRNLDFVLEEGKITALVGSSGCGKSTVASLALRMWDPMEGKILLDGHEIQKLEPEFFYRQVSCVFQEVVLFHETVLENIRLGRPDATDEEVKEAAKLAFCDSFIQKLPDGYETVLAENGNSLSGGERQRIAIARAILKDAPILILDEATSHLDAENELLVQKAIANLSEDKTVLMIAHRLRNIVDADQILVMDAGEIVGRGTHDQLMEKCSLYEKLYRMQEDVG